MLNSSYEYQGNQIRFKSNLENIKVEWDGGLSTDYLTNTYDSNTNDLDSVMFYLPTEIQFKLLSELIKTDPYLAFRIIIKYNLKTFYGLTSALIALFTVFVFCQTFINISINLFR
jgi:hypothetical protein